MYSEPRTLAEARKVRYGAWGGRPRGWDYVEGRCAYEVFSNERGTLHHQCERRNGHGPAKLYCRQHATRIAV